MDEEELSAEELHQGVTPMDIPADQERIHRNILGKGRNWSKRSLAVAEDQERIQRKIAADEESRRASQHRSQGVEF